MEYIKVNLLGRDPDKDDKPVPVLINEEENGITGNILEVEEGIMEISVSIEGAESVEIEVIFGTTSIEEPQEVNVNVEA